MPRWENPTPRTFRRCPSCGVVRPASDFKRATGKPDFGRERPTRCPKCGHVGQFQMFRRADPPARPEEGEG
jgi:hypothetical protein